MSGPYVWGRWLTWFLAAVAATSAGLVVYTLSAQGPSVRDRAPSDLVPLAQVRVPEPPDLDRFVRDRTAAVQLGKALFWDVQVGSDGNQACASCHFAAGADRRTKNTLHPGTDGVFQVGGPNATLAPADFPFTRHAEPGDPQSPIVADRDDIVGSQGVTRSGFDGIVPGSSEDLRHPVPDPLFHVQGKNVRQVTGRNAPSAINAVFNFHNFWDGRANNTFNGVTPFGPGDSGARIWWALDGQLRQVTVEITSASLASQAVGPPLSDVEMSAAGRTFPDVGKKLLSPELVPLGRQEVHPEDNVLGPLARSREEPGAGGLRVSYADLVRQAFLPQYWSAQQPITLDGNQYSHMEANFPLFFGLAVQLYETTLVSDQTPFDLFLGGDADALTPQQRDGFEVFTGEGRCSQCHRGTLLTEATSGSRGGFSGFFNIGVRPTQEDLGAGPIAEDTGLNGAFKTPGLRNVELTGPYFHNGGKATLRQVVDFYNRGGDFANQENKDSQIRSLGLTEGQRSALVAFLLSLTDERVRWQRAPFDHPELCLANGHEGGPADVEEHPPGSGVAKDALACIPAVGAGGAKQPLEPFLGLDPALPE